MPIRTEAPPELSTPGLVLLWGNSPNGWKGTYLLQALKEAGYIPDYTVIDVDLTNGEQFQPWYKQVNPNSKMPALLDNLPDQPPVKVFESASILLYLCKTYDLEYKYWFKESRLDTELISWLFWTQSNLGPMQGQMNHFYRYIDGAPIEYATNRYTDETKRLYQVLDDHLSGKLDGEPKEYLVGGKFSLADMCAQPWTRAAFWGGLKIKDYPFVLAWHDRINALPVVQTALKVPVQDLVTRVQSTPGLEQEIMERMRKQKEENARKRAEEEKKETSG